MGRTTTTTERMNVALSPPPTRSADEKAPLLSAAYGPARGQAYTKSNGAHASPPVRESVSQATTGTDAGRASMPDVADATAALPPWIRPSSSQPLIPAPRNMYKWDGYNPESMVEEDDVDRSGRSIFSSSGGNDAMTYDAMMQLSLPRNPLRQEMFRSFLIWFTTSCILFATNQLTTLPVGFFPSYAQEHLGMTSLDLSFFFSVYPLCIMISSPLAASVSPFVGRQTVICLGLMLSGSTTIAFAYSSTSGSVFVLRILQGIGAGAAVVGAFSMITEEFSASVGQVLVIQEFVVAAAFISAPPLGSALYEYGGFEMPFLAAGVAQLLLVMIVPFLFIEYALPDGLYSRGPIPSAIFPAPTVDNGVTFKDVLTPTCLVSLLITVFAMASFGFIDPFLGSHMQSVLGAQHVAIGFGFALSAFVYFLGGILYVWLSRKCGCKHVIICGLLQLAVGFFFLGPPPFLNSYFNDYVRLWSTQWLSLVCIGCGAALSIAPGLPLTLMSVSTQGTHAFNLVIGLFSSAIYCGQALGPFLALLLMHVLPSTPTSSCFAESAPSSPSLDSNVINACDSSLPWAFTVYSFVLLALLVFVIFNLSTGDDIIAFLKKRKRVSLSRQTSEYGQFIFLDDNEDEVS